MKEKVRFDDGVTSFQVTQDVSGLLEYLKEYRDNAPSMHGQAAYRYVGSIPRVLYDDIVRRLPADASEQEINAACIKFLRDADHAAFVVRGV